MNTKNFLKNYPDLPEISKALLRLKAMLYFRATDDALKNCLAALNYLFPKKGALSSQMPTHQFNDQIKSLIKQGFLGKKGDLPRSLIHPLTIEAFDCGHSKDYLNAVQTTSQAMAYRLYGGYSYQQIDANAMRLAIYNYHEKDAYRQATEKISSRDLDNWYEEFFLQEPLDIEWLQRIPLVCQQNILYLKLHYFCLTGNLDDQIPGLLAYYLPLREKKEYADFAIPFLLYDILCANIRGIETALKTYDPQTSHPLALQGIIFFLSQKNDQAIAAFEEALKRLRKVTGKKKVLFSFNQMFPFCLALLATQNQKNYQKLEKIIELGLDIDYQNYAFRALRRVLLKLQGFESKAHHDFVPSFQSLPPLLSAIVALADYWFDEGKVNIDSCKEQFEKYKNTLPLVARIFAEILCKIAPNSAYQSYLDQEAFKGFVRFVDCVQMGESWQRALDHLNYYFEKQGVSATSGEKRLVWYFDPNLGRLEGVEQSFQAKGGGWSKGRAISLKRFYDRDPKLTYLIHEDQKIIKAIFHERSWGGHTYDWHTDKMLLALVGHPAIYHADKSDLRLDFILGAPELVIKHQDQGQFHVSLSHAASEEKVFIEQETPSRYRVIHFPKSMAPLIEILGSGGITVPAKAKDHLVSMVQKASPILPIHSDIEFTDIPAQAGDTTPCIHLHPLDPGIKIVLLVRPFGDKGPYFRPGHGRSSLIILQDSKQLKAIRALETERKRANDFIKSCSPLNLGQDGTDEWIIEDPEDCLETLFALQEAKDIKVEWPEGEKLSVTKSASFNHLSLKIDHQRDWFAVEGSLKVDEDTVISLQELLTLMEQAQGRFIPLSRTKFMALSSHFKKQLQELKAIAEETKDGYRIHGLGSLALNTFADQVAHLESDKKWKDKIKSFKDAQTYEPQLPTTLQASLRDYQKEGFDWLSRLAYLGVGACLADDMGLGKTVQALAVMLNHAPQGPCLIVAPTSVCHNWMAEIEKFAPTLTSYSLGNSKREELVASLKAMDVLICSYSLLQQEEALLTGKEWEMIVLDESQAIKNASTKRFQAAIKLQGKFKLALTGTPIENSLEDIWSLFRFINPGLLGSRESFQKRFLTTVAPDKEKGVNPIQARSPVGLKNLVQMFMLRRTKSAVLQELPPRTEQTIMVEMTPQELAFYETLRREAIQNITSLADQQGQGAGQRKIHILAEITRLRRACCHPTLAHKEINFPSSKLKTFFHLIDDLLQNNHQALVFSQYVEYLKIVSRELEAKNISYQYLDGSTPAPMRKKQVQDFQEGKSPLFLLSLKAGGSGLNLTAADYVIHLDPWWNPAVEDQASDRAHRLGQKRPVTIYRLIVQNSIEEKILALHKDKRDMADDLLEGSHITAKMSEEDLLNLISF